MKSVIFLLLTVTSFAVASCTKHSGDMVQPIAAVNVLFSSPTVNGVYHLGDSIIIEGRAIAAHTLHGYDLVIKSVTDSTVYFSKHVHDHNDTLLISQKWKADIAKGQDLEVNAIFAIDHDGNKFTSKVVFKVQ